MGVIMNLSGFRNIVLALSAFTVNTAYADESVVDKVLFKVRGQLYMPSSKEILPFNIGQTNLTYTGSKLVETGIGGEVSGTYFINEYVAFEVSAAVVGYKMAESMQLGASTPPGGTTYSQIPLTQADLSKRAYMFPLAGILQIYPLPNKKFSPYIGAGYHRTFTNNARSGIAKFRSFGGVLLQAGCDMWTSESFGMNFDLKKYWGTSQAVTHFSLVNSVKTPVQTKVRLDPFVVSLGVGWKL